MIYLFNEQEELIRIVNEESVRSLSQREQLTDENYVSDKITAEIENFTEQDFDEVEYVAIPSRDDKYKYHLYFVLNYNRENDLLMVDGVSSGAEELKKTPVYDMRPQNRPLRYVVERLLNGTNWTLGYTADVGTRSTNYYYTNIFEALKHTAQVWGVEFQFYVEINNDRIGDRYIEFQTQVGGNHGARVTHGHNALQILSETSKSELYTALIGRGKGEEVSSAEDNESGQAGYGRKINFKDVEWSVANGDPVDKPLGQEYVELPQATQVYGIKTPSGMKPKIGFAEFSDQEDKEQLLKDTYQQLLTTSRPQRMYKASTEYVNVRNIGDTIRVEEPDKRIDYETRVFDITWDRLTGAATDIKLGDYLVNSNKKQRERIANATADAINNEIAPLVEAVTYAVTSANGKNTNFYGPTAPDTPRIGDLWFRPHPDFPDETIGYVWNGEIWEEWANTYDQTENKRIVEQALSQAQEAKDEAQQSYTNSVAYTDDKVATETTEWNNKFDSKVSDINTDIGNVREKASNALTEAGANNDLLATHESALDTINNTTLPTLENGLSDLENTVIPNIQSDVQTAQNSADSALSEAQQALDDVDSLDQSVQTSISNINGKLSSKAEQTTVNDLETTVSNHSTTISQNETDIKSKADSSTVDTLNNTVENHTTKISQNAEDISVKADSSTVNQLTDDVETNTADISINADEISRRLTSTEVDNLVDGKGYSTAINNVEATADGNKSTITNIQNNPENTIVGYQQVTETADLYERVIGSSENEINDNVSQIIATSDVVQTEVSSMEFGGRNLLLNSSDELKTVTWSGYDYGLIDRTPLELLGLQVGDEVTLRVYIHETDRPVYAFLQTHDENSNYKQTEPTTHANIIESEQSGYTIVKWTIPEGSKTLRATIRNRNNDVGDATVTYSKEKLEKGTVATDWTPAPEDQANYTDNAVSTVQTQLDNSWAVQTLNSDKDVMAEIAVTDSTARIQGKNILLDGQVTMEQAFIDDIQAHSIDAVEADITSIVTNHLGANAITANHLDVTNAMIDELFATEALVKQLTTKNAFIMSIQATAITADQIQAGTLNANLVNVINMNVNDLVGNRLNFITGAFSGLNTDMYLNAHGITIDASEYTDMRLDRAGVTFDENGANTPIGGVSVLHDSSDQSSIQGLWLFTNRGYNTSISYEVDRTDTETVYRSALMVDGTTGQTNMYGRFHLEDQMDIHGNIRFMQDGYHRGTIQQDGPTDDINLRYSSRFKVIRNKDNLIKLSVDWNNTYSYNNWIFNKWDLTDIDQIRGVNNIFTDKLSISTGNEDSIAKTKSGILNFNFRHKIHFVRSNQGLVKWSMGSWSHVSYAHINLKNYNLLNVGQMKDTSDRRLKTNIEDYSESMLETFFEAINPVTFNWKDADKTQEQQIGLIAQDTPIISDYTEETDTWSIDSKKQIMINTFGVKELLNHDTDKENRIRKLEAENEGLKDRIKQLEGAV